MTIKVLDAGTLRTARDLKVMQAGVVRRTRAVKIMHGGTLRTVATFADPLAASVSPSSVSGIQSAPGEYPVVTGPSTAAPVGGTAPFTYAWVSVSGYGSPNNPTANSTNFTADILPGTYGGTFRVTITDAYGQTASADVSATFTNLGGGIGP